MGFKSGSDDHGALTGLSDDDHPQYLLLAGRSGGQTAIGGTGAGDNLVLTASSNADEGLIILSRAEDEATSEGLRIRSTRATRAAADEVYLSFYMPTTDGTQEEFGRITALASDVDDGTEDGMLVFSAPANGTFREFLRMGGLAGVNDVFINNPQNDVNFRVLTPNAQFCFLVDGGQDNITFGANKVAGSFISVFGGVASRAPVTSVGSALNITADTYNLGGSGGTFAVVPSVFLGIPTYAATASITLTDTATLYIQGAPDISDAEVSGTNQYSLWVDAGGVRLDSTLAVGATPGVGSSGQILTSKASSPPEWETVGAGGVGTSLAFATFMGGL